MLLQTVLTLSLHAAGPTAIVLPIELGGVYLKRSEVLIPAVKRGLTAGGVTVLTESAAVPAVDEKTAHQLFTCSGGAKKCIAAILGAGVPATVVIRTELSRGKSDGRGLLLQAYSVPEGRLLSTFFEGGVEGEDGLAKIFAEGAGKVAADLRAQQVVTTPDLTPSTAGLHATASDPFLRKVGWGLLAATAAAGIFSLVTVARRITILNEPNETDPNVNAQAAGDIVREAEEQRITAVVAAVTGAVVLVPAVILLYLGFKENPVSFEFIPGVKGITFSFDGVHF